MGFRHMLQNALDAWKFRYQWRRWFRAKAVHIWKKHKQKNPWGLINLSLQRVKWIPLSLYFQLLFRWFINREHVVISQGKCWPSAGTGITSRCCHADRRVCLQSCFSALEIRVLSWGRTSQQNASATKRRSPTRTAVSSSTTAEHSKYRTINETFPQWGWSHIFRIPRR